MHFSTAIENWNRRFWNGLTRFQTSEDRRRLEKWGEVKIIFRAAELVETFYKWRKSRFRLHPLWKFFFSITPGSYGLTWPDRKSFRSASSPMKRSWKWWLNLVKSLGWGHIFRTSIVRLFTIIKGYERLGCATIFRLNYPIRAISAGATFEFRALSVTFQIDFSWCKQSTAHQEVASVMILIESRLAADFLDKIKEEVTILRVCELKFRYNFPRKLCLQSNEKQKSKGFN